MGRKQAPEKKEEEKKPEVEEEAEDSPIIKELKGYDDSYLALEKEYEAETRKLKEQFDKKMKPFLEDRKKLLLEGKEKAEEEGTPACPGFWLQALKNHPTQRSDFGEIHDHDEPVLQYLTDITSEELSYEKDSGFKLSFHFKKNPYFAHEVLSIEVHTEEDNPYTGDSNVKEVKSTQIEWETGKDVTVEIVAKKVKGGGKKKAKQKGKETAQPRPSFFRLFRNLKDGDGMPDDLRQLLLGDDAEEMDEEDDEEIVGEFLSEIMEVTSAFKTELVPFAVRWYTGEAKVDDDDDDEDSEEESDDDDDDDDESSEDAKPAKKGGKGGKKAPGSGAEGKKEECKQQ